MRRAVAPTTDRPGEERPVNADGARVVALSDCERHAGAGRLSDAEEVDQAITDLARVIATTAVQSEVTAEYAQVVWLLVKARRALRASFPSLNPVAPAPPQNVG